jgi:MFS family permease
LRAVADGYVAILLPVHLSLLGFEPFVVGVLAASTLLGSALLTTAVGATVHRFRRRSALLGAALLMTATGLGLSTLYDFWPLLVIAFVGTLNPSGGDVSVFPPLEHTVLAHGVPDQDRTALFARYSFAGACLLRLGRAWRRQRRLFVPVMVP